MNDSVRSRLEDTLEAARLIDEWVGKYSFDEMSTDRLVESAFLLQLERIGETLRIVRDKSPEFEKRLPKINRWIGLRHRIVHDYREIDLNLLWLSVEQEVPLLIQEISMILAE